jgi:acyl-CoA thioesterase-1
LGSIRIRNLQTLVPCLWFYTVLVDVRRILFVSLGLLTLLCPSLRAAQRTLVCFGDSITAGYGLPAGQSFPDALDEKLHRAGYSYKVNGQGTPGATTKDAVASLPIILALHPEIVIVEFGGNDGLRGLPLDVTKKNLDLVLTTLENAHIKVLLAGITLPSNYGPDYITPFEAIFRELAAKHHTAFVPMLYKDIAHVPGTLQADGIHPTAKGSEIIADTLMLALKPLLHKN